MVENIDQSILLLTKLQYCHVIDNNSGEVRLVEGPYRGPLESNEDIYGKIENKLIVKEGQYAIILNPYDKQSGDVKHGDTEIRVGPTIFSLYPGEILEKNRILNEYVLIQDTGLLMKALRDFKDDEVDRKAGDLWIVEGPTHYIPHKYSIVEKLVKSISLGHDEGIYVKNNRTGRIRLEKGPKSIMLSPEEEPYKKDYTKSEIEAIKIKEADLEKTKCRPLWVLENEATLIMSEDKQKFVKGPEVVMLDPFERPYIMDISGGTPKGSERLKIWKIKLGPNFSTDILDVRTKDNAVLKIKLRYKWKFNLENLESKENIFSVSDFIGLMTETMASIIRDESAKHDFEKLHSEASEIIKNAIFDNSDTYIFKENGLTILGIDIKNIAPDDEEIAKQLNDAIKSNMDIYVNKIKLKAENEAKIAKIEAETELEEAKESLIELKFQ